MPIANFPAMSNATNFKKTEFISLTPGQHIIRILTEQAVIHNTHYARGVTFKCLGDSCPVCRNNASIRAEKPNDKNFENVPGYIARRPVAYINVLDRTPAKICPKCSTEVKKISGVFSPTCPKCNASIVAVKTLPLNKVKVLSKGRQFFDQVEFHNSTVLDEETQTPLGVTNFDLGILVMGGKTTPAVSALETQCDPVEVSDEDLYDLEKSIITLDESEIKEFLRGTQLRDIFLARKSEAVVEDVSVASADLVDEMAKLFSN